MPDFPDDDARWAACLARDPAADGAFVVAVRTTRVYCRPICSGRPLRRNVEFHPDAATAARAGFRPCKRCWRWPSTQPAQRAADHAGRP